MNNKTIADKRIDSQEKEINKLKRAVNLMSKQLITLKAGYARLAEEDRRTKNQLNQIARNSKQ